VRIAFHAINGVGLGHVVRAICLAREIPALVPGARTLVVTNAHDTTMLEEAGLDHVQLPPRLAEPHADPMRSRVALPEPLEEAALTAALEAFGPDLVVFDTHAPLGVVRRVSELGARTVLVLRELRPEALAAFASSEAPLLYDRIVVPHVEGEVDPGPLAGAPVTLVGPIVRALARASPGAFARTDGPRRDARRDAPRVVALAGGGGQPVDARRYLRAVADAHLLARARVRDLETVLVTGPYGAPPANLEGYAGLTVLRTSPDLPALLASAALVVSQAGYNAVAELRALEKPAVLVPGYRKAEDQRARAERLARAGAAVIARPEARSIADRVERLLVTPGALDAMTAAHARSPLVPQNAAAAVAALGPVCLTRRRVERAVIVAHDLAPKLGGMETVARALARGLLTRGVDVRVYTTSRLGARTASGLGEGVVQPLYLPRPRPQRIDLWADLLATIDAARRDAPDAIHLCHAGLGPWIPALRAAFPAVVTAHVHGNDLLSPWVHPGATPPDVYRDAVAAGLSAADAVIAVSRFSADLARREGVASERVRTIENGVDPERFCPGPRDAALAARLGLADDDEVLLTVSRLAPRKGHRTVLRALAALAPSRPHLRYVFTGASDDLRAELLATARELGVASRVVAAGFVSEADLPALYRLAHAFVLVPDGDDARDVEGFGVALLEAAATGVAAIGSRTGGVPEAVEDGVSGLLVPPCDPEATARAVARLLDDRGLAASLGERGRARVLAELSHERATTRLFEVWNEALARGSRGSRGSPGSRGPRVAEANFDVLRPALAGTPLAAARTGVDLVRIAARHEAARRAERAQRTTTLRAVLRRERIVRLRATSDGARLLPDALDDCVVLGHAPTVEIKLRRFLDPDFVEHALPLVAGVELVHGLPHDHAPSLLASLRALPDEAVRRVRTLRLFLTPEARERASLAVAAVPEAHALRRFFAERGAVVVPPPELMRYLSELPAGGPETGMIEPTNLCNLACPTCPTGTGKIKPLPAMSVERFDDVLGALAPRMRNLALWNYGEPLLNKDLPAMIARAKEAGVRVVKVSSNVHFLDGARGSALLRSGLDVLILSVDGASQETYATFRKDGDFARVAASVAWLSAEKRRLGLTKPRIELQFIVMRHNEHELPAMRRLAREWGVDALRVKTVGADDEETRGLVPASRLLSRYQSDGATPNARHAFCTMAWDHTVVNVDGSVTPCCYLRPDMGDAFVMGNVFEKPFAAIWRGERYRAFRAAMLEGRANMPVCDRCRGGRLM